MTLQPSTAGSPLVIPKTHVKALLQGKVCLAVRPFQPNHWETLDDGERVARCPWRTGHSYMVKSSSRGQEIARIRVLAAHRGLLHEVDDGQAVQAGFDGREALVGWWRERYHEGPGTAKHVVEIPVWIIDFELDLVRPTEYLRRGPKGGYTTSPSEGWRDSDTLEWCPPRDWANRRAQRAREDFKASEPARLAQRRTDAGRRSVGFRLEEARRKARLKGIDVTTDERVIAERLERMERKVERDEAA